MRHPWIALLLLLFACEVDVSNLDQDGDTWPPSAGDCDDDDPDRFPNNVEIPGDGIDQDCDGEDLQLIADNDGDGSLAGDDCDDEDPFNTPGFPEVCDGQDNNCDGVADEGFDADEDGVSTCGPDGSSGTGDEDCDDEDAALFPGNPELCDAIDQDCDGEIDEGFDEDEDGWSTCGPDGEPGNEDDDCHDTDDEAYPLRWDDCDGVDVNCNGVVDEDADADGDGFSTCDFFADCDDENAEAYPDAPEQCNEIDDDCDGDVDEDFDGDGDGFATCSGDCDDSDDDVYPGAREDAGDGVDQDCDGADQIATCEGWPVSSNEIEPNDSSPNTLTAVGHVTLLGTCAAAGDVDKINVTLPCGGPVRFELDTTTGPLTLQVFEAGSPVAQATGLANPLVAQGNTNTGGGTLEVQITCGTSTAGANWDLFIDWE